MSTHPKSNLSRESGKNIQAVSATTSGLRRSVTIFTIGYGGKKPTDFPGLLERHGIKTVIDVRLRPNRACLGSFVKAKTPDKGIEALLARVGIDYRHEPMFAPSPEILDTWMASKKSEADWQKFESQFVPLLEKWKIEELVKPDDLESACLLCSESKPENCHRRLVAEYLRDRWFRSVRVETAHL